MTNFDSNGLEKFDNSRSANAVKLAGNNFTCPFPAVFVPNFAVHGEVCVDGEVVDDYSGELKGNYLTGEKRFHHIYAKGKLHGVSVRWYKNGQIAERNNYLHGKQHEAQASYYSNGQLARSARYSKGYLDGLLEGFRLDGAYKWPPSCHEKGKKVDISKCSGQESTPPP